MSNPQYTKFSPRELHHITLMALQHLRGDEVERAEAAFAGFSPLRMQDPYLNTGMTPAQLLAITQHRRELIEAAILWVSSLPVAE